ncbi:hypothetical protein ACP70R_001536 [Stipagrostis hirtigluma subsp. patula]
MEPLDPFVLPATPPASPPPPPEAPPRVQILTWQPQIRAQHLQEPQIHHSPSPNGTPASNPNAFWADTPPPPPPRPPTFPAGEVEFVPETPPPGSSSPRPTYAEVVKHRPSAGACNADLQPLKSCFKSASTPPAASSRGARRVHFAPSPPRRSLRATPSHHRSYVSDAAPSRTPPSSAAPSSPDARWTKVRKRYWWRKAQSKRLARTSIQRAPHSSRPGAAAAESLAIFQEKTWGRCFRCLARDHRAAHCRDPIRCLRCRRSGHRERDCSSRSVTPRRPATVQHSPAMAPRHAGRERDEGGCRNTSGARSCRDDDIGRSRHDRDGYSRERHGREHQGRRSSRVGDAMVRRERTPSPRRGRTSSEQMAELQRLLAQQAAWLKNELQSFVGEQVREQVQAALLPELQELQRSNTRLLQNAEDYILKACRLASRLQIADTPLLADDENVMGEEASSTLQRTPPTAPLQFAPELGTATATPADTRASDGETAMTSSAKTTTTPLAAATATASALVTPSTAKAATSPTPAISTPGEAMAPGAITSSAQAAAPSNAGSTTPAAPAVVEAPPTQCEVSASTMVAQYGQTAIDPPQDSSMMCRTRLNPVKAAIPTATVFDRLHGFLNTKQSVSESMQGSMGGHEHTGLRTAFPALSPSIQLDGDAALTTAAPASPAVMFPAEGATPTAPAGTDFSDLQPCLLGPNAPASSAPGPTRPPEVSTTYAAASASPVHSAQMGGAVATAGSAQRVASAVSAPDSRDFSSLFTTLEPSLLGDGPSSLQEEPVPAPPRQRRQRATREPDMANIRRSARLANAPHLPAIEKAQRNLCRKLGLLEREEDPLHAALQAYIAMFSGPLPEQIIAALTAIFNLDDEQAQAQDAALLQLMGEGAAEQGVEGAIAA